MDELDGSASTLLMLIVELTVEAHARRNVW